MAARRMAELVGIPNLVKRLFSGALGKGGRFKSRGKELAKKVPGCAMGGFW